MARAAWAKVPELVMPWDRRKRVYAYGRALRNCTDGTLRAQVESAATRTPGFRA